MLLGHSRVFNDSQHIVLVLDEDLQEFPWVCLRILVLVFVGVEGVYLIKSCHTFSQRPTSS